MMAQQFDEAVRWVIVDDGRVRQPVSFCREGWTLEVIRPAHRWKEGANTQAANLLAGLAVIDCSESVVIIEDDDAYLPAHLSTMAWALTDCSLVGQRVSLYYNVATRRERSLPGSVHASLGASAMQGEALALLRSVCNNHGTRIDLELWRQFKGKKQLLETSTAVGIKGLPGRGGIGCGHRKEFGFSDPSGGVLADWIGADLAAAYLRHQREGFN